MILSFLPKIIFAHLPLALTTDHRPPVRRLRPLITPPIILIRPAIILIRPPIILIRSQNILIEPPIRMTDPLLDGLDH